MGIYERDYKTTKFTDSLQNNALVMLITINLVVFVLFTFVNVFYFFSVRPAELATARFTNDFYNNLAIPGTFAEFIRKPWTLVTHMFYHQMQSGRPFPVLPGKIIIAFMITSYTPGLCEQFCFA